MVFLEKGRMLVVLSLAAMLAACASAGPPPTTALNTAEAAIRQAETADAREFEPVMLNRAQNKVRDARRLIEQERHEEARRLLDEASVDAELAAALAEAEKAERALHELNESIDATRQ